MNTPRARSFELFIALRYLFSQRKQTFISVVSIMSILGVALGVGALVVVLGVYNGFSTDMRDKILGANAHALVMSHVPAALNQSDAMMQRIASVDGVKGATPFLYAEAMLSASGGVKGVVLRGIEPHTAPAVLTMLQKLQQGSVSELSRLDAAHETPGIIVGYELARRLGLGMGDRVNLLSPSGKKSSAGFQPSIHPFEVVGIFKCGLFEYDSSLAYISLAAAQNALGLPAGRLTGIELTVNDVYAADTVAWRVEQELGQPFYVRHWMEMNANLFAALKLEKVGMFILLTIVVLIGSFSIVTSLVMLVMEKTRDIAIMMSMGATRGMIRRIFMLQGTIIGLIGTAIGYLLGFAVALLLQKYQFIELPKGVYTMDHLPMLLTWSDNIIIGVSAMLLCFLATIYPARQASRLEPVEALRHE
ncbi:MAG: lipoprotein-releasing ABC transporter permease subunit [Desulfovibrionaceae bacterium]|nr:lipoprotein-releasing ABC transporter permease subunit [Desulfovibrionaceae bacterium]